MEATASVARRRTSTALIAACASLALAVLLAAAPAQAADECRPGAMLGPLPFSSFQGADGDQCNITGTAGSYDWQKIVADGGFGTGGGTTLVDSDTATGLNVFKGGSKEQEPENWGFTSDFPNNKTNILAAWGYPDAQPNHLFLYLAFARQDATGSVNYSFELNQNPPSETFTTSQGATVIKRKAGDLLIAYDRTGNSSVVIKLCRWLPTDPADAHLEGTWSNCTDLTASGLAQAETNLTFPITNFLQGGGTLAAGQFGEAAIDLTSALNLGGPGQAPCADFGAFWVRSRQSGSITSDPSDFIAPSKIGVNNCGRVVIKKTTVGTVTVPPTKFDFTADFNAVAEGMPDTSPAAFQLAGGDTETVVKVQPGTYSLAETDPTAKGYDLTGLTCMESGAVSNVATTTSLVTRTATLRVDSGEEVTCTYTNTRRGQLIVEKQTLPDGDLTSFGFTTGTDPFSLTDGQTKTIDVAPGTYGVAEDAKRGWSLSNLTCDDADSTVDRAAHSATVRIAAGEIVRCTFTNTKDGRLIVEKQTLPDGDAASFGFTTTAAGNGTFSLTDGATESRDVTPGSYTATEDLNSGWELTTLSCDDQNSVASKLTRTATFDVSPGEIVTCTFTNTKDGKLIVEKQTLPDGDNASFGFTTTATGAGTFSLTDGGSEASDVKPGTYTATENIKAGWELTSLSCSDQNSTTDKPGRTATFDIAPGEMVTCTFTNTKEGRLIVEKQTLPDGDAASFGFTTTATGAGTFSLVDGGEQARDVKPGTYTATENAKAGWELTGLYCSDQNSTTDRAGRVATFDIAPGEMVTCTFVNTKDGRLIVEKQTLPDGDAASFGFTTTATGAGTFSLTDGATESRDVMPGTYTATEDVKGGWDLTGLTCDDENSSTDKLTRTATFDISAGETVTCTFVNTKDARLTVEKQTLPDGDPATFSFETTAPGAGTFALGDNATESRDVKPGTYTASEGLKSGWELTGLSCSDQNSTTDQPNRTATFDVSPGEHVTCTFTNTKEGRLIVEKQTLPDGDGASFGFETTATGAGTFSLTDDGQESRDVVPGTYTATENVKAGWQLTGLSCSDQNSSTDKDTRTATFDISAGETVTCTFTNTKDGRLIVEKQTLPDGDPAQFDFATNAAGAPSFKLSDGQTDGRDVKPGTYTATEAAAAGYRLDQVSCDDADSTGDKPSRTATFHIAPGETVICTFLNRTISANAVVVKAGNEWAYHGDTLTFTFTVDNSGQGPLTNVVVSDDRCAPVTLREKRDINANADTTPNVLDLTDTWIYECSMPAPAHTAGETNPLVNTVAVSGLDEFQRPVSDTDQHSTLLIHPAIAVDKTGPATAQAGQPVRYTLVVTNPGDAPFLAPNVNVADALCQAPPMLTTKNGDATPGQLDPGDTWTYTCTVQTLVGQTVVNNVATVTGTDSYGGRDVSDDDPATTQLTQPPVAPPPPPPVPLAPSGVPEQVKPVALPAAVATAGLSGPRRCVSGPFQAKVTGRGIAKVRFLLDGKKVKTVMGSATRTVFAVRIDPRGQHSKAHRITAQVTFKAATRTRDRTLRFVYLGCARTAPKFTG